MCARAYVYVRVCVHACEQMAVLYQNAKDKHANGLKMLMKHFDYHPQFKRWSDTFTAVPFRPK